jgi:hypothetical protein
MVKSENCLLTLEIWFGFISNLNLNLNLSLSLVFLVFICFDI